jgi:hypothetical protein
MSVMMIRAEVNPEHVGKVEAAAEIMFAAIKEVQPKGVRYTSLRVSESSTFVILLELEGADNSLRAIPAVRSFQEDLQGWLAAPPVSEKLTIVGEYRSF